MQGLSRNVHPPRGGPIRALERATSEGHQLALREAHDIDALVPGLSAEVANLAKLRRPVELYAAAAEHTC